MQKKLLLLNWIIRIRWLKLWYLCIYVTAIKPNFHERFRVDKGINRNMPTKCMCVDTTFSSYIFNCSHLVRPQIYQFWYLCNGRFGPREKRPFAQCSLRPAFGISTSPGIAFSLFFKWRRSSHVRQLLILPIRIFLRRIVSPFP